jgi:hypothetical protein
MAQLLVFLKYSPTTFGLRPDLLLTIFFLCRMKRMFYMAHLAECPLSDDPPEQAGQNNRCSK